MPIFLVVPSFDGGGAILDSVAQPGPAFVLFTTELFDTSAFHFLRAACEASNLGMAQGAYATPIFSRTQFKQPPFRMFTALRASCSFGPKHLNTLSPSV
jgi:hypothetical protein